MIQALIAVDRYGGMGFNGTLPWPHHAADMSYFKKLTAGHVVVMGRNSWNDLFLPKHLVDRTVYVATTKLLPVSNGANKISGDIKEQLVALESKHPDKIIWVVGGTSLITQCTDVLDKMYITHHKKSYKVDSKLDLYSFLSGWQIRTASATPGEKCAFLTYEPLFKRSKPALNR